MVIRADKLLCDDDIVRSLVREGLNLCRVHLTVQVHALGLLGEHDRHMEMLRRDTGDSDSRCLDCQDLGDRCVRIKTLELLSHLVEQLHIHLVIQEAVHFQDISRFHDSVFSDAIFQ